MTAVCTPLSIFLLAVTWLQKEMQSIGYNSSDGSLHVESSTPKPTLQDLKDGWLLIKVA